MKNLLSLGLLAGSLIATAETTKKLDDVIVTATRTETATSKINRSITVITNEEITQKKAKDLADLLAQTPGLDIKRTGPRSNQSSISIRGMRSYHTKIMIDGIALQDTTTPQITPTIPSIPLENIERIEIIRGSASTLYGSNAMGGIINIITKKSKGDCLAGEVDLSVNTHGDQSHSMFANGNDGKLDYSLGLGWIDNHSISSRKDNDEKEAFRNLSLTGQLGYQFTENLKLSIFGIYEDQVSEYDNPFGVPNYLGDWHIINSQIGTKLDAKNLFDDMLDTSLRYSFTETSRNDRDNPMAFKGRTNELDWQNILEINDFNRLILGLTYTDEYSEQDSYGTVSNASYWTQAYFANYEIEPVENLIIDAGLRYNNHSEFGGETTYSASASYYIDATSTKLKTSWGTGYRAPSLVELYGAWGSNQYLQPETSESWDIGFEQEIYENLEFGMTYFTNRVTDYIGYTGGSYKQISGIKIYGIESYINYRATKDLRLNFTHTYQHSNNMETDKADIIHLPDNKFSASINWAATEKLNLNINGLYVTERGDVSGAELNSYTLINIAASYQLTDTLEVYGKIDNILDKDYEEVAGYNTYGITGYAGLKYRF